MLALAASYVHQLDPFAIQLTDSFGVRWYGLAYAAGFLVGWLFVRWFATSGRSPLTRAGVGDLMTYAVVGVLVGGRVGYAIFYEPSLLVGFSSTFPWWDLLAINKGGMASHGGIAGVIIACVLFGRRHRISSLHLLDMGATACTAGLFLGRLANFVNAELWGRALPPSRQASPPWWSIKYPDEPLEWLGDATRLVRLGAADELAAMRAKLAALRDAVGLVDVGPAEWLRWTDALDAGLLRTPLVRLADLAREGNDAAIAALRPHLTAYYPSQLIQALTDGPILFGVLALIWLKPRTPGVVGAWFLITYGLLRIATEVVRQPDEGVALWFGLSRGQILSVLMVVVGAIGLLVRLRSGARPMGGLLVRSADAADAPGHE